MPFISADLNNVEETATPDYSAIPAGEYVAVVSKVTERTTNAGHLAYSVEFTVVDGQYQGRKAFTTLNINHPNEVPRNISLAMLKSIVVATGNDPATFEDTDALLDKPVRITLTVRKSEQYGEQNDVRAVRSASGEAKAASAPAPKPAVAAKKPWEK